MLSAVLGCSRPFVHNVIFPPVFPPSRVTPPLGRFVTRLFFSRPSPWSAPHSTPPPTTTPLNRTLDPLTSTYHVHRLVVLVRPTAATQLVWLPAPPHLISCSASSPSNTSDRPRALHIPSALIVSPCVHPGQCGTRAARTRGRRPVTHRPLEWERAHTVGVKEGHVVTRRAWRKR